MWNHLQTLASEISMAGTKLYRALRCYGILLLVVIALTLIFINIQNVGFNRVVREDSVDIPKGNHKLFTSSAELYSLIKQEDFTNELLGGDVKIYIYNLPDLFNQEQVKINVITPPKIRDPTCTSNFYSAEISFHKFLLYSSFSTSDPWKADFFYVPSYSSCFLINNQPNNLTKTATFHTELFHQITTRYNYFNLSQGRDHIWMFSQGFGAKMFGDWKRINNGIFLVHNGQYTLDDFTPHKDVAVPPDLSGYGFLSVFELPLKKRPAKQWLGHFGGTVISIDVKDERGSNYSKGVRQYIKKHYSMDPDFRITGTRVSTYIDDMMSSTFCLCPEGWHSWNPRPYQAIILGCIPVLLSDEIELAFEDVLDYSKFMVRVRPENVSKLKSILRSISPYEVQSMQKELEKVWRFFVYHRDGLASYMIMEALYRRKTTQHIRRRYLNVKKIAK